MRRSTGAALRQSGAALLVALLLMALVATAVTASLWQHWRDVQVQVAERERLRAAWVLAGALDWARGVLREDAGAGPLDHAGEPWARPLNHSGEPWARPLNHTGEPWAQPLAAATPMAGDEDQALSVRIVDLQSRLNAGHLASVGRIHEPTLRSFERLFALLGLPPAELALLAENLRRASDIDPDSALGGARPVPPQRLAHLAALGLSPLSLDLLAPYVTVLPGRTPLNLNTASAEAIHVAVPGASLADAKRLVAARAQAPVPSLAAAAQLLQAPQPLSAQEFSVGSQFFEVQARLRLAASWAEDRAVVQRDGLQVMVLQRERGGADASDSLTVAARSGSRPPE